MKIFVGGSLRKVPLNADDCEEFVRHLGEWIVEDGHVLYTGARGSLDAAIAGAAADWLDANGRNAQKQLISYRLVSDEPAHERGQIQLSTLVDWELNHRDFKAPEQIEEADVAVFIAGSDGTFLAANWARIADKPVLGVARFGGAGKEIYEHEADKFPPRYSEFIDVDDFKILGQDTRDGAQLAKDVIALCRNVLTPEKVFTIMSFEKKYDDVFDSYKFVCKEAGFDAVRTDKSHSGDRITKQILEGIRRAAFVIADVTEATENVFFEIGYADGLGRPLILTAEEGTTLPFDIKDVPVVSYRTHNELKDGLRRRVEETTARLPGVGPTL